MGRFPRWFLASACLLSASLRAEVINYQGRLQVDGAPFRGVGAFRFDLVDPQGRVSWSSGEVALSVADGRYAVRLGDSPKDPAIVLAPAGPPASTLRVWFRKQSGLWAIAATGIPLSLAPPPAAAAPPAAPDVQAEILAELRSIHALLAGGSQKPGAPAPDPAITLPLPDGPSLGQADAPLVLVEYLDYQCPYCVRFFKDVFPRLRADYVGTGKLRVVSMQLPLPFHPFAAPAARAAVCAEVQDKFWVMRDRLFAAEGTLPPEALRKAAAEAGLDAGKFQACSAGIGAANAVQSSLAEAKAAGIEATPSFVLGRVTAGKITGIKIIGALPFADFAARIDGMLAAPRQP